MKTVLMILLVPFKAMATKQPDIAPKGYYDRFTGFSNI